MRRWPVVFALLGVLLAGQIAAASSSEVATHVCVNKKTGVMRWPGAKACKSTERLKVLTVEGLQGEPGPAGPAGPAGPQGPAGQRGPAGSTVESAIAFSGQTDELVSFRANNDESDTPQILGRVALFTSTPAPRSGRYLVSVHFVTRGRVVQLHDVGTAVIGGWAVGCYAFPTHFTDGLKWNFPYTSAVGGTLEFLPRAGSPYGWLVELDMNGDSLSQQEFLLQAGETLSVTCYGPEVNSDNFDSFYYPGADIRVTGPAVGARLDGVYLGAKRGDEVNYH